MRARKLIALFTLVLTLACGGPPPDSGSKPAPAPAATPPAAEPTQPAPEPEPPKLPSALDLPPRRVVEGDGIKITEIADGSVNLKTTTTWNEEIDTTYQTCDYFLGAVPVLRRQLATERAKLLDKVCTKDKKAAAQAKPAAQPHLAPKQ